MHKYEWKPGECVSQVALKISNFVVIHKWKLFTFIKRAIESVKTGVTNVGLKKAKNIPRIVWKIWDVPVERKQIHDLWGPFERNFVSNAYSVLSGPNLLSLEGDWWSKNGVLSTVPDAPERVKAVVSGENAVVISWLPPRRPNGLLIQYTVYIRVLEQGQEVKITKSILPAQNLYHEATGLKQHETYEAWVTASTKVGQGSSTPVIKLQPSTTGKMLFEGFWDYWKIPRSRRKILPRRTRRCNFSFSPEFRENCTTAETRIEYTGEYTERWSIFHKGKYSLTRSTRRSITNVSAVLATFR